MASPLNAAAAGGPAYPDTGHARLSSGLWTCYRTVASLSYRAIGDIHATDSLGLAVRRVEAKIIGGGQRGVLICFPTSVDLDIGVAGKHTNSHDLESRENAEGEAPAYGRRWESTLAFCVACVLCCVSARARSLLALRVASGKHG